MTRESIKNMLVFKDDCISRPYKDGTLQPFEVVCADENVFVIGPVSYDENTQLCTTSYDHLEAYSNDKTINTLESLGFVLCNEED